MLLLLSVITVALMVYVLRLCVPFMNLVLAIGNGYLFVYDVFHARYAYASVDALCFGANVFSFCVFWSCLDVRLFREKAGVLAPGRVWVFMIGPFMYLNPSLTGLARQVVTEWCNDKHLVG